LPINSLALALSPYNKPTIMKNLKKTLILALLCLFVLTALAQPGIGLKAGANYSSLSGYSGDQRLSIHAGLFVHVPINDKWSFQPELIYSGEGRHYVVPTDGEHEELKGLITLDYVALPIMFRFNPGSRFFIEAGPQIAVLVAAHSKGLGTDDMNMKRSFSNGQFSLNAGAGISLNQRIAVYGRYSMGMTNITPSNSNANKSSAGQVGIAFRLGKQRPVKEEGMPDK
jgi:hypothetical protein